jgi:hypothetical protein
VSEKGDIMSQNSETRIQTEKNILDAFWQLYKMNGFRTTTVKDVIKKAGYNRSTFYDYFVDLEDVLEKIEHSLIPTLDSLPPINLNNKNIGMPVNEFLEVFKIHQEYYMVLLGENGDPKFVSRLKDSIKKTLFSHMKFNDTHTSIHSDFALEYVLSGMIGILLYWLSNSDKITEADVISLISEITPSFMIE